MHEHQPDENLADFTDEEILKLIDSGTVGAFSEIYRRHIDSSALGRAGTRRDHDNALLAVLGRVLDSSPTTSDDLQGLIEQAANEESADHDASEKAPIVSDDWAHHSKVALAFSGLPDNWQRILWLREVEKLTPKSVAERLNITAHAVSRLTVRARQELRRRWRKVHVNGAPSTSDLSASLIPALLSSPTLIERFADILSDRARPVETPLLPTSEAGEEAASHTDDTAEAASQTDDTAEAASHADDTAEAEEWETPDVAGPEATASAEDDAASTESDTATLAEVSVLTPERSYFRLPKPVLIPVAAACVGLLGSLVGLSLSPLSTEHSGYRTGVGSSSSAEQDAGGHGTTTRGQTSSGGQTSEGARSEPGSSDSAAPQTSGPADGEKRGQPAPTSSQGDDEPTDEAPPSGKGPDDHPEKPEPTDSGEPGSPSNPSPSEPEEPTPSEPNEPTPTDPDEPTPSEPDDPTPTEPDEPDDPTPSEPDDPSPSEPDEPTPSEPDEPDEPTPSQSEGSSEAESTPGPSETEAPEEVSTGGHSQSGTSSDDSSD